MSKSQDHEIAGHHLNHKQLTILRKVFAHPVAHNLTWHEVHTLLDAVGDLVEEHNGSWKITIGGQPEVYRPNHHKELTTQEVLDLRRTLAAAGIEPQS
jgi:hypothetical protein